VTELERIAEQLKRAFERDAWHGPAVLEVLEGVTAERAHARPIAGAHTVWELVLHLSGAYRLVLRRLRGDGAPLTATEDWPPVPAPTEANWQETVRALRRLNLDVREAVRAFPGERLDQPLVPDPPYTAYTQFIGLTQHDLYHAGQISLLKRALGSR
jgi:uncharacterized damage-inducible protein DinB